MKKKKSRIFITIKCIKCIEKKLDNNLNYKKNLNNTLPFKNFLKKKHYNSGISTYYTTKNRLNTSVRITLKKYCRYCNSHTIHKEIK